MATQNPFTQNLEQEKLMPAYETGPEQLDAILEGLSESQLDLSRGQGKWTIREIVHHIWDVEDIWQTVIKAALGNTGCTFDFSWYIRDNKCAVPLDYANRPINGAVQLFKGSRPYIADLVKHLPKAMERNALFTQPLMKFEKNFTVDEMINRQIQHLEIHLKQIRETREVHGIK